MNIINELLDKANRDSKKGLLKDEQKQYRESLFECFKENGLSEENILYLLAGLKFGTINTFFIWNRSFSQEEQLFNLNVVLSSQKFLSMDNVGKLRMLFLILVTELNETTINDAIVGESLHCMVELSYKKDGSRLSDLGKIFKNYFMSGMKTGTKLPSISKFNFSKEYEIQLMNFFEDAVSGIEPIGEEEIEKRNILRNWIKKEYEKFNADAKTIYAESYKEIKTKNKLTYVRKDDEEISSVLGKRLYEIAKSMDTFDKLFRESEEECKKKGREISRLKTRNDKLEALYNVNVNENTALRKEVDDLRCRLEEYSLANKELEDHVRRQVSVIDVYDQDKANTRTELLNQIATALKKIYMDYKVAEKMEMTIDLGENMRDSLDDVFRKLKKFGINIEGR